MVQHQQYDQDVPYLPHTSPWHEHPGYQFQHPHPIHDYGYTFDQSPFLAHSAQALPHVPRSSHQHLTQLVVPPWPSTLTQSGPYTAPVPPASQPMPFAPISAPPTTAPPLSHEPTLPRHAVTPRKTLTDADRRRMCLYHEENPNKKQSEIGEIFGVERSTVSKVLRQKDKYLQTEDGSKSPARRKANRLPDLERALVKWAKNQLDLGVRPSDESIMKQARLFATGTGSDNHQFDSENRNWLEKFKQKMFGPQSRKGSMTAQKSPPLLQSMTVNPDSLQPVDFLSRTASPVDSANATGRRSHRPFHSQSNASPSSAFADSAPPLLSASSTHENSPIFSSTPEHAPETASNAYISPQPSTQAGSTSQRARSQTFPLGGTEPYISPPPSNQALTPKFATVNEGVVLESPQSEMPPPTVSINGHMANALGIDYRMSNENDLSSSVNAVPIQRILTSSESYGSSPSDPYHASISSSPHVAPSNEEAHRALEILLHYVQNNPASHVEPHELKTIQHCLDKLKITGQANQIIDTKCSVRMKRTPSRDIAVTAGRRSSNAGT